MVLDSQIIDWSLRMVREENPFADIDSDAAVSFIFYDALLLACSKRNYLILSILFGSNDWFVDWDKFEHASHGPGHENMVMYGLMLYALKRTGYKVNKADDMKPLMPLVLALSHGGDFPQSNCRDLPLEFVIESVKASVPVQES